jgi:gentisate 1,2-dioxygenase
MNARTDIHTNADAARDAIFYVPEGAFDRGLAAVPPHVFMQEQQQALHPDCPTGLIPLDLSGVLGTAYPATTPLLLARYIVLRAGERLEHAFHATGEIHYVARGTGTTTAPGGCIAWRAGDAFVLPGASLTSHVAETDSLLVCFTNEPELSYAGVQAPRAEANPVVQPAYFDGRITDEKLGLLHRGIGAQATAGKAVILATTRMQAMRTILPSATAAFNTLEPGGDQRPHRHNAAALTFAIESEGVHSKVAGDRIDWIPFGLMVTPPQAEHSHHNRGPRMMKSFVVQDGALYYQLRNPGFAWTA